MGEVIQVNFGRRDDALLSKKQLAAHPSIRRSTRWVEQRVREGMPSQMDGNRRMFSLPAVQGWLEGQGRKVANG